ncbi:MAG: hypothetical protein ACF8R7_17000 [Phycisphaerales bacterium JB039]
MAALGTIVAGCMRTDLDPLPAYSTCYKSRVTAHVDWCLAPAADRNFHHTVGRHYIIYGRYNGDAELVKEGVSRCKIDHDDRSVVNACTPGEVMAMAAEALPEETADDYCEAGVDPRRSLWDC